MSNITITLGQELQKLPGDFQSQLSAAFAGMANQADEWLGKANAIKVESEADADGMKLARASRLELRQIRIKAEKARKELKAGYLAGGRAVDAVANVINGAIEPIEEVLLEKEEFVERKAAKELAKRSAVRANELQGIGVDWSWYQTQISEFTNEQWGAFAQGQRDALIAKAIREADEAAAREIERKRVAELDAENARLRAEKEAAEKAARLAQYRAQQEAAAVKAQADAEAAKVAAENARVVAEERRKAAEVQRAIEAESARVLDEERMKMAQFEAQLKARKDEEARAWLEAEAAKIAAQQAPEVEKVKAYIAALQSIPVPRIETSRLFVRLDAIVTQIQAAKKWIETL